MGFNSGTSSQPLHLFSRHVQREDELTGDFCGEPGRVPARACRLVWAPHDGRSGPRAVGGAAERGQLALSSSSAFMFSLLNFNLHYYLLLCSSVFLV